MLVSFDEKLKDIALKIKDIAYSFGLIADYVVETGTSGIWTYQKWASGIAHCFGWRNVRATTWAAWGYTYVSEIVSTVAYPFAFIEEPEETLTINSDAGSGWPVTYENTKTHTSGLQIGRNNSNPGTVAFDINYDVWGRWK